MSYRFPVLFLGFLLLAGCTSLLKPEVREGEITTPIEHHWVVKKPGNTRVLVLLPGISNHPHQFLEHGFDQVLADSFPETDLLLVDAHFGYYREKTLVEHLWGDLLQEMSADYQEVWLGGISLGGFGSLLTFRDHGDKIDRVLLLSPYMGDSGVSGEVVAAGGVEPWLVAGPDDSDIAGFWRWMANLDSSQAEKIWLGYGRWDPFSGNNDWLAEQIPESHTFKVFGSHEWYTWTRLWKQMIPAMQD